MVPAPHLIASCTFPSSATSSLWIWIWIRAALLTAVDELKSARLSPTRGVSQTPWLILWVCNVVPCTAVAMLECVCRNDEDCILRGWLDRVFSHALNTVNKIRTGSQKPPSATRLQLYGLYKQAMGTQRLAGQDCGSG